MLIEPAAAHVSDQQWLKQHNQWIKHMPIAVVLYGANGEALSCNQRAVKLFGFGGEAAARQAGSYINRARLGADPVQKALQSQQQLHDQTLVFIRSDGQRLQTLANVSPLLDDNGVVAGAICTIQPVAGEPQEPQAGAGQERLPEVIDGTAAFAAELRGPYHLVERANHNCKEMMGGADLIGKTAREAWPQLGDQGYLDHLDRVYATGEPFRANGLPLWLRPKPGAAVVQLRCNFSYQPLRDVAGEVYGVLVTIVDVTARGSTSPAAVSNSDTAERKLRLYETILANTPDLVYVFDLNHRFTYANAALLEMWGKTWDDAIGKGCLELGYESWHASMHDREIDRVVRTKQEVRGEVPFNGTAGVRYYDYIFVPVIGDGGEVEAVAGTARDSTGRKQLERELQRRADDLSESDRKKDEFIAMLAHELRNPLAPIRNGLQVMEMAAGEQAVIDQARAMMQRQLAHMVRLVDDLLDVSRITRNKLNLQKSTITIDEVIDSAIETTKPALEAAGHTLSLTLPPQPYSLHADFTRLAQVFSNLLSNSIKYTKPGGHIAVQARAVGEILEVEISDNGIGIPPHKLTTVFELFSQVSSDARDGDGGLGIGLALVQALVAMHGGTVEADSNWPANGAKFTVKLPYLAQSQEQTAYPEEPEQKQTEQQARRVLVVDDNHDACRSMSQLFDLLGHEVRSAFDGLEALRLAEEFKPEVIFMDLGMPNLNGFEATRQIRSQPWGKEMLIIAVTGWGQDCDRTNSKNAGFDGHLVKPVNLEAVQEQLALLDRR